MQSGWSPASRTFDVAHEMEHLEGIQHHHDADGTVHYDDSSKSAKHHAEHAGCGHALALPSHLTPQVVLTAFSFSMVEFRQFVPERVPERPQRPPQQLLG